MHGGLFTETTRAISVLADCTQQYVGELARAGLVDHVVASDGTRLFQRQSADVVRQIKAQRLAKRGAHRRVA